jgi:serine/threonine-protein kinase
MESSCATPLQDGRFLLLETLGSGGMGRVYRAFDRAEQRLVALKVPTAPGRSGPAHPLAAEFDHWSRFSHPNIVRVYEMVCAENGPLPEGTPYLVLEHVHGRPAHRALRPGTIGSTAVENLAVQVLSALAHVHAAGYVHRDLKPGNVLAEISRRRRHFKLTDFGLSVPAGRANRIGTLSGSLPYAAPESLLGLPLDGRADLFALGVLLYQLATGEVPGPDSDQREYLRWHLEGPALDVARTRGGMSTRLRRFIRRLTMRDRDRRPDSADRALEMLGARDAWSDPTRVRVDARGALASLRLALDAARLGSRRVFPLVRHPQLTGTLLRELRVWCQVRGLPVHALTGDVERFVLRLLADRGGDAARLVRRFDLQRHLSLVLLGGVPLRDPASRAPVRSRSSAVQALADLVADCAAHRPLVVCAQRTDDESRLARALRKKLVRDAASRNRAVADGGGLLLVVAGGAESGTDV